MAEIWDAYDENMKKIENATLVRGESVQDGMYHMASEIIVRHVDGTYLLMQRDLRKHLGGMWELTAGGSALVGEKPIDCAKRELNEETGIESDDLIEIGRIVNDERHVFYVVFLCTTDCEKDSIVLQEGETIAYKWVTKDELLKIDNAKIASSRTIQLIR